MYGRAADKERTCSIVAFTAYYWLLDRFSATVVATHTHVNPAVAVLLGWAMGGEHISAALVVGLIVITSAVLRAAMPFDHIARICHREIVSRGLDCATVQTHW